MKIRIEEDVLEGTGTEIMDQLRGRVFDPTEFPDTESYIWFLQSNVILSLIHISEPTRPL